MSYLDKIKEIAQKEPASKLDYIRSLSASTQQKQNYNDLWAIESERENYDKGLESMNALYQLQKGTAKTAGQNSTDAADRANMYKLASIQATDPKEKLQLYQAYQTAQKEASNAKDDLYYLNQTRNTAYQVQQQKIKEANQKAREELVKANLADQRGENDTQYLLKAAEYGRAAQNAERLRDTAKYTTSNRLGDAFLERPVIQTAANLANLTQTTGQVINNMSMGKNEAVTQSDVTKNLNRGANEISQKAVRDLSSGQKDVMNAAMSIEDNALSMIVGGYPFNISSKLPLALMMISSAAQKMGNLNDQGVSANQSLVRGGISGAIEGLTENVSLGSLTNIIKAGGKNAILNIIKQAIPEATEEGASYILNYLMDAAYKDPNANFSVNDLAQNMKLGAMSGGFFGGVGTVANVISPHIGNSDYVKPDYASDLQKIREIAKAESAKAAPVEQTSTETSTPTSETPTAQAVSQTNLSEPISNTTEQVQAKNEPLDGEKETPIAQVLTSTYYKKPIKERIENLYRQGKRLLVDEGDEFHRVGKMIGDDLIYPLFNNAKQSGRTAEYWISQGQTNAEGKTIGKSLASIFDPIVEKGEDYYKAFSEYLFHMHNIDRMSLSENYKTENKPVFGESVGVFESRMKAQELLQEHPEFTQLADEVYQYNRNMMQYRVETGLVTQEQADAMNQMYPHYVPTFRDTTGISGSFSSGRGVQITNTIKKAKGSNLDLLPVRDSMARQTMQTVQAGKRNLLGSRILDDALQQKSKLGNIVNSIDYGDESHNVDLEERELSETPNTLKVYRDGKLVTMKINAGLYQGWKGISAHESGDKLLERGMTEINNTFKKLVTAWNPTFLVTNFAKDLQDAGLYTTDAKGFAKNYPRAWSEISKNSELWQQYQALGGFGSSIFDYERGYKVGKNGKVKTDGRIARLNFIVEQVPRFTEFLNTVEKEGTSYSAMMHAMYNAADVTVNFGRSGTWVKTWNRVAVPFLNPSVQGSSKLFRTLTKQRTFTEWLGFAGKCALLSVAPSMINALLYWDDDEWKNMRDTDKDNYFLFKIKSGLWLKVPKGRAVSILGNFTRRTIEKYDGRENSYAEFIGNAWNNVGVKNPISSTILEPLLRVKLFDENSPGKTWYGTNIESQSMQNLPVEQRYDESTDYFSIALGNVLGLSPAKINDLLDSSSGVIGDYVLPIITPQATASSKIASPILAKFTLDTVRSNKIGQQFYAKVDEVTQAKNKDGISDSDYALNYLSLKFLNKQKSAIDKLNAEIRKIQADTTISDGEKFNSARELKATANTIQANALASLDALQKSIPSNYQGKATTDKEKEQELKMAYLDSCRDAFGAEYALQQIEDANDATYDKALEAKEKRMSFDDYYDAWAITRNIEGDKVNGKTVSESKKKNIIATLRRAGYTDYEIKTFCEIQFDYKMD